jgi:hypothetical protein
MVRKREIRKILSEDLEKRSFRSLNKQREQAASILGVLGIVLVLLGIVTFALAISTIAVSNYGMRSSDIDLCVFSNVSLGLMMILSGGILAWFGFNYISEQRIARILEKVDPEFAKEQS